MGSFGISEGHKTEIKKTKRKPTEYASNHHSQQRSTPDACVHNQQVSAGQGGTGCMLRVRTRPECPEDNLRDLTWDSNPAPEMASSTKLWAGLQLLITSSWDPGQLTSARSVTAWHQLPRGDTQHTRDGTLMAHLGHWAAGTMEETKTHGPPGTVHSPSTWLHELLGPGKDKKRTPNQVRALAECLRTWIWAAQTWEVNKTQGPHGTVPMQSNLEPEQCRPGKHMPPWAGANPCGPYTMNTPYTCQWYLFAVFLKRWEYQTTSLPSWEISMQVRKQQLELDMEQQTGSN